MDSEQKNSREGDTSAPAKNPLGTEPVGKLLFQFALPSIIAMLVSSLYNIVDQFFIGRSIGELGNAATNISFPLTITCTAIALFFGIGGSASFNIAMGQGRKKEAAYYMGNAAVMLITVGVCLTIVTQLFLTPLLRFFGSPDDVLPYAQTYTRIVSFGFPFLILTTGGGHLIRADGRPRISMLCNLTGAIINTFLDALFVFGLHLGMAGAATATVIGQVVSGSMAVWFLAHCRTVHLTRDNLRPRAKTVKRVMSLGIAPGTNQLAMMVVQIVMNKSLKYYGALSIYGESIPLACVGIITKVNQVFMAFIIGISQGMQPITSFNTGAEQYGRVKKAYLCAARACLIISVIAFLLFQLCPRQIISLFGEGSEEYYTFAENYFRIYLFFTFLNFLQPITTNFLSSVGKPLQGTFMSLTRQIIFLLPLILILPVFLGIDGIMYAGPIADLVAAVLAIILASRELSQEKYRTPA